MNVLTGVDKIASWPCFSPIVDPSTYSKISAKSYIKQSRTFDIIHLA